MARVTDSGANRRLGSDACPGLGRPFAATDGAIVRLRTGARPVTVAALAGLLDVVRDHDDPHIQLTSRGALQLRGLPDPVPAQVRAAIVDTGLVPSASHELARNIVASPLSGLDGRGLADVRDVVRDLDERLCADPRLALLPGRFLFAVDDGRGDVTRSGFDLGILSTGPDSAVVIAGGLDRAWQVATGAAVELVLALAREFLDTRERLGSDAWHVRELGVPIGPPGAQQVGVPAGEPPSVGAHGAHGVVGVPLGMLAPAHVAALRAATDEVIVTPWRSLVVPSGAASMARLGASGLATDPSDPWLRLHACTGLPGCARSAIDTRAIARELAPRLRSAHTEQDAPRGPLPVHISGCERRCGTPGTAYVDVLAPDSVEAALKVIAV